MAGAIITLTGTAITFVINRLFIPQFSYMACAWATFACYASMMVISFVWGQKRYFVPYAWKKLLAYLIISVLLFFVQKGVTHFTENLFVNLSTATILIIAYLYFITRVERKEFQQLPVIGKYIR